MNHLLAKNGKEKCVGAHELGTHRTGQHLHMLFFRCRRTRIWEIRVVSVSRMPLFWRMQELINLLMGTLHGRRSPFFAEINLRCRDSCSAGGGPEGSMRPETSTAPSGFSLCGVPPLLSLFSLLTYDTAGGFGFGLPGAASYVVVPRACTPTLSFSLLCGWRVEGRLDRHDA